MIGFSVAGRFPSGLLSRIPDDKKDIIVAAFSLAFSLITAECLFKPVLYYLCQKDVVYLLVPSSTDDRTGDGLILEQVLIKPLREWLKSSAMEKGSLNIQKVFSKYIPTERNNGGMNDFTLVKYARSWYLRLCQEGRHQVFFLLRERNKPEAICFEHAPSTFMPLVSTHLFILSTKAVLAVLCVLGTRSVSGNA